VDHYVGSSGMMFFPPEYSIRSKRIKLLVIYSPSYGEDHAKVIYSKAISPQAAPNEGPPDYDRRA
jgi:hypothetical protein